MSVHPSIYIFYAANQGLRPCIVTYAMPLAPETRHVLDFSCLQSPAPRRTCFVSVSTEKTHLLWSPTKGLPGSRVGGQVYPAGPRGSGPEAWEWRELGGMEGGSRQWESQEQPSPSKEVTEQLPEVGVESM